MTTEKTPPDRSLLPFDLAAFVSGLAHAVANPLNAVSMNCELLKMALARGEMGRARDMVERVLGANARCGGLMRSLRGFASALRPQVAGSVSIAIVLDGAIRMFKAEYSRTAPEFRVRTIDALVHVDRAALESALLQLLRNSAEAGSRVVEVEAGSSPGKVLVDVRDDGEGFVPEDRERFATPFYSTHRMPGNAGLGLTLARELLRLNGGTLAIVEPASRGAHIRIELAMAGTASGADRSAGP